MTTTTQMFSLDNLEVFRRPGVKEIEPRTGGSFAGCWVRFENGWTLSIQWGIGNYGDNHGKHYRLDEPTDSTTAEIAAIEPDGDMVSWGTDPEYAETVQGYVSMARVQHVLDLMAEDRLTQDYQPPTPPVERRAIDNWTEDE